MRPQLARPRAPISRQKEFAWVGRTPRPSTSTAPRYRFQSPRCRAKWRSTMQAVSPCCSAPVVVLGEVEA